MSPLVPKLHDKMKQKSALLFSCYMTVPYCSHVTYDINMTPMTLLWWMGVVKCTYQFSSY